MQLRIHATRWGYGCDEPQQGRKATKVASKCYARAFQDPGIGSGLLLHETACLSWHQLSHCNASVCQTSYRKSRPQQLPVPFYSRPRSQQPDPQHHSLTVRRASTELPVPKHPTTHLRLAHPFVQVGWNNRLPSGAVHQSNLVEKQGIP